MSTNIISQVRKELRANVDEKTRQNSARLFKEEVKFHGVTIPKAEKIGKKFFEQIKNLNKETIFGLCEELLKSGYIEEAFIAYNWADYLKDKFEQKDFAVFERWLGGYVSNWAECDTLCNHSIASFLEKFPEYIENLKKWTGSQNRWMRRGAAVTLVLPARKGLFLEDVFEIADSLLLDEDDLVQKGYGWILKEASKQHQKQVFDYIMKNKDRMPRTALRYAIEKMPPDLRKEAMKK